MQSYSRTTYSLIKGIVITLGCGLVAGIFVSVINIGIVLQFLLPLLAACGAGWISIYGESLRIDWYPDGLFVYSVAGHEKHRLRIAEYEISRPKHAAKKRFMAPGNTLLIARNRQSGKRMFLDCEAIGKKQLEELYSLLQDYQSPQNSAPPTDTGENDAADS